jgi:hypothetical protein
VAIDTIEIRPPITHKQADFSLAIGFLYSLDIQGPLSPGVLYSAGVSRTRALSTCSARQKIRTHTHIETASASEDGSLYLYAVLAMN